MAPAPTARMAAIELLTAPGSPFEVVEQTVRGLPMRVFANAPATLVELLSRSAEFAERDFLVFEGQRWTFGDHLAVAKGLAHWLAEKSGLRQGDRVAISMRNFPEWAPIFAGVVAAGMVAVPLNAWWTREEFAHGITDSGAKLLFVDGERAATVAGLCELVVVRPEDEHHGAAREWTELCGSFDRVAEFPDVHIEPDDMATILYTSGTTGKPKGSIGSHRNHCTNAMNMLLVGVAADVVRNGGRLPEPAPGDPLSGILLGFPIFHTAGLSGMYSAMLGGVKLVLLRKWDSGVAISLVRQEELSGVSGVPTMARQLLAAAISTGTELPTLKSIGSGGAPSSPDLVNGIAAEFAGAVAPGNGYGLTETTSGVVFNGDEDYIAAPDSAGRVVPVADIAVVDPRTGERVAEGENGELCFYGPNIFHGYWNNKEATDAVLRAGWFATGDLGCVRDGLVYVLDRIKDMVLRGGENVYCVEVESAIFAHPAVQDVAVFALPHRELGEQVAAVVVRRDGAQVSEAELRDFLVQRIARFKVPEAIRFATEPLPRNQSGKVIKRTLRSEALDHAN
jgi:acyl-CoA synthetase (AMP-forming)/AMP-acid ligase II